MQPSATSFDIEPGRDATMRALYDEATTLARIGAWACDLETDALTWTHGVYDLFGLPRGAPLVRERTVAHYREDSRIELERLRSAAIRERSGFTFDANIRTLGGETRWMRVSARVVADGRSRSRLVGAKQDVTAEKLLIDRLRFGAERDALTGLHNRGVFQARFDEEEEGDAAIGALVLIDLDRFKTVNDRFGHAAGDACLRHCAVRLREAFPHARLVARIGGDEFAVLLSGATSRGDLSTILRGVSVSLGRPVPWQGEWLTAGASIGAAVAGPTSRHDPSAMFAAADAALYAAKAMGGGVARVADVYGGEVAAFERRRYG